LNILWTKKDNIMKHTALCAEKKTENLQHV